MKNKVFWTIFWSIVVILAILGIAVHTACFISIWGTDGFLCTKVLNLSSVFVFLSVLFGIGKMRKRKELLSG